MSPSPLQLVILKQCMEHKDEIPNLTDNVGSAALLEYGPLCLEDGELWWTYKMWKV